MVTMKPGSPFNEYFGRSTDTKPVAGIPNASTFYEINTGAIYMFDAEEGQWYQQYAQQDTQNESDP